MPFGTLIRTRPSRAAAALLDAERALDRAGRPAHVYGWTIRTAPGFEPRVQAVENEREYVVSAELPGVETEDLQVVVEDGVLSVTGLRKGPHWSADLPDEERSRHEARFTRRIRFNGEIDDAGVSARYRNGLLTVSVPKARPPEPEVRTIPVEVA